MENNNKIFIQIASYRDPQLLSTLKDCVAKAKNPENLVFSITWQHSKDDLWDDLSEFKDDIRFRIIDVDYKDSKGACWARNALQQQYVDEEYTLQLDSHHRFIQNWDEECILMIKQLQAKGHEKPLLTGYISSFDPENDPQGREMIPWKMNFDRFIPEGAVFFLPASIDNFAELTEPIPARFYSAHFCFTLGSFVKEVPHDPEYYFHGEEISLAVRAYTWGYDLFHPHKVVAWHEYTRKGRTKQWDDDPEWAARNNYCHKKNRQLFGMDGEVRDKDFGIYDFGKVRSLHDYEKYSGLCFAKRSITQHVLNNEIAPIPEMTDEEFDQALTMVFKHCIDIMPHQVLPSMSQHANGMDLVKAYLNKSDFWVVAFENDNAETIYRKDADENEIKQFINDHDNYYKVWRTFNTIEKPVKWVVWIHHTTEHQENGGWGQRIEGKL
jgi:glycosyltransferase involved in cell wall biosynthesis